MSNHVRGLALALFVVTASVSQAAPLNPGTVFYPAVAEPGPMGGSVVATLTSPFSRPDRFSGNLRVDVIQGDTTNALGGLTFLYTLTNDGVAGISSIARLTVNGYAGWTVDGSYSVPISGVAPSQIDRSNNGDTIGFSFQPSPFDPLANFLMPGETSTGLVLQTDAQAFTLTTASVIDGAVAMVDTYAPVPEPATLGAAAVALAALRRRKN